MFLCVGQSLITLESEKRMKKIAIFQEGEVKDDEEKHDEEKYDEISGSWDLYC
jgi:hypothetical protein